jgi:hypothetical protein
MADFYGATLYVPKKAITAEIQKMVDEYMKDYPDCEVNEGNGLFTIYSPEARWGEFEEIESALTEAEIPFDRDTDANSGNPAFAMYFRPGITPTPKYVAELVEVREIRDIVNAYSSDETRGQLYGALTYYLETNFPTFPVLEDMAKEEEQRAAEGGLGA